MKDWKEFNEMKDAGWKTKTQDEYTNWQSNMKKWYKNQTDLTEWDKEQIKLQLQKINDNKQAYFNKQQNKKQYQPKVTYLLQPELAQALTEYIKMKTLHLQMQMEYQKNALDARDYC